MRKYTRAIRKKLLLQMFEHLRENYQIGIERDEFIDGRMPLSRLDAILAFKSDLTLDDLRNALDRIDHDSFGFCTLCKRKIVQADIDENPTRRYCEQCERSFATTDWHEVHQHPV